MPHVLASMPLPGETASRGQEFSVDKTSLAELRREGRVGDAGREQSGGKKPVPRAAKALWEYRIELRLAPPDPPTRDSPKAAGQRRDLGRNHWGTR